MQRASQESASRTKSPRPAKGEQPKNTKRSSQQSRHQKHTPCKPQLRHASTSRVTGNRVMCPCCEVHASQWLRPRKLRIFEGEGVDSTENKIARAEVNRESENCDAKLKSSKSAERDEEQVRSSSECKFFWNFCCLFSSHGSRFGYGPVLSVLLLQSRGPTPNECEAADGPPISAAAHPSRQGEVSTHCRLTGRESVPLPGSRPGVVSLE